MSFSRTGAMLCIYHLLACIIIIIIIIIIISYLKLYKCIQTYDYYQIEIKYL